MIVVFFQSENKIYLREEKRDSDVLALRVTKTYKMQRAVELCVSQLPSLGVPGTGGKVLNNCLNLKSINYKVSTYFNWQSHCLLLFLSLSLCSLFSLSVSLSFSLYHSVSFFFPSLPLCLSLSLCLSQFLSMYGSGSPSASPCHLYLFSLWLSFSLPMNVDSLSLHLVVQWHAVVGNLRL